MNRWLTVSVRSRGRVSLKIPDSVKIGAQTIAVNLVDRLESRGDGEILGFSSCTFCEIFIAKKFVHEITGELTEMPEVTVADTFLHEIIHAISVTYGLDLKENQVAGLAGGLLAVIRDNDLDFRG